MDKNNNQEEFNLKKKKKNRITPRQLNRVDIMHLIRTNNIPELKDVLYDLSQENFAENDYFEFQKNELKLIKAYQIMMQYMMLSINQLEEKNQTLGKFIDEQIDYNEAAEEVLQKQNKKIRNQEEDISKIVNNCKNMEFLIKQLGLEERIKELGIKPVTNNEMEDKDLEELRKKMINSNNMGDGEENKNP